MYLVRTEGESALPSRECLDSACTSLLHTLTKSSQRRKRASPDQDNHGIIEYVTNSLRLVDRNLGGFPTWIVRTVSYRYIER